MGQWNVQERPLDKGNLRRDLIGLYVRLHDQVLLLQRRLDQAYDVVDNFSDLDRLHGGVTLPE